MRWPFTRSSPSDRTPWGRRIALGPVVSYRLARAERRDPWERSAWEAGQIDASTAFEAHPGAVGAVRTMLTAGLGAAGVSTFTDGSTLLRFVVGAMAGLAIWYLVPTGWAIMRFIDAPRRQRNEAREFRRWARIRWQIMRERRDAEGAFHGEPSSEFAAIHYAQQWVPNRLSLYASWLREWGAPEAAAGLEARPVPTAYAEAAERMRWAIGQLDDNTRDPRFWSEDDQW